MSDTVEILAAGAQQNVSFTSSGQTPLPVGFAYGEVPLASQRKGSVIDVSERSSLRVTLDVTAATNRLGDEQGTTDPATLFVALEHRPAAGAAWEVLHTFRPMRMRGQQRVSLSAFHGEVRASWYWLRSAIPANTYRDNVVYSFGISAEALPVAA